MIVVAGEGLVDVVIGPDGPPRLVPGGGPMNTARTIARLGVGCAYLGRLSTDRFGRQLQAQLEADGVDKSLVVETHDPTTLAIADLDENRTASYQFYLDGTSAPGLTGEAAAAALDVPDLRALHVGTLGLAVEPIATSLERLVTLVGEGVIVMVDPNCRPVAIRDSAGYRARMRRVLMRADVVKVSTDDLAFLEPDASTRIAAQRLIALGPSAVLVTDGARAVVILTRDGWRELPVPRARVVDTVGSGDAFGGGFLACWHAHDQRREELRDVALVERAARVAIRVAGMTCERPGADPPTLAELGGWS